MPGPAPKLRVVEEREGRPGKGRRKKPGETGVVLPPATPDEPDWLEDWPRITVGRKPAAPKAAAPGRLPEGADEEMKLAQAQARLAYLLERAEYRARLRHWETSRQLQRDNTRARELSRRTWRWLVPILDAQGLLTVADPAELHAFCLLSAQIDYAQRDIARRGMNVESERGLVKNPSVSAIHAFRASRLALSDRFGLSPLARDRLNAREGNDDGGEGDWG